VETLRHAEEARASEAAQLRWELAIQTLRLRQAEEELAGHTEDARVAEVHRRGADIVALAQWNARLEADSRKLREAELSRAEEMEVRGAVPGRPGAPLR
jgi:hypothetical protein